MSLTLGDVSVGNSGGCPSSNLAGIYLHYAQPTTSFLTLAGFLQIFAAAVDSLTCARRL